MRTEWWLKLTRADKGALALLSVCALAACAPTERVLGDDSAGAAGVGLSGGSGGSGAIAGGAGSGAGGAITGGAGSGGSTAIAGSAGIGGNTGVGGDLGNGGTSGAGSCVVGGKIYPNGSGVKDPFSCNSCTCDNGSLSCTDIGCEVPCPVGTAPGTQCLQCGPADGCLSREYKCLPTCTDQTPCADGDYCFSGTCHLATGICG